MAFSDVFLPVHTTNQCDLPSRRQSTQLQHCNNINRNSSWNVPLSGAAGQGRGANVSQVSGKARVWETLKETTQVRSSCKRPCKQQQTVFYCVYTRCLAVLLLSRIKQQHSSPTRNTMLLTCTAANSSWNSMPLQYATPCNSSLYAVCCKTC